MPSFVPYIINAMTRTVLSTDFKLLILDGDSSRKIIIYLCLGSKHPRVFQTSIAKLCEKARLSQI